MLKQQPLPELSEKVVGSMVYSQWSLSDLWSLMRTNKASYLQVHNYLLQSYGRKSIGVLQYFANHGFKEAVEHYASVANLEGLKLLLDHGSKDQEIPDAAMEVAAQNRDEDTVEFLLNQGANANNPKALEVAAERGFASIVKLLELKGTDVQNTKALTLAVQAGHIDIVEYLVNHGGDGEKALEAAAQKGDNKIINILVENGAEISTEAIRIAAHHGHYNTVKMFIDYGVDGSSSFVFGAAAYSGNYELVCLLINNGALSGEIAYEWGLEQAASSGSLEIVRLLLERGADPQNNIAMKFAAEQGFVDVLRLFFEYGATVQNDGFDTVLYSAVSSRSFDTVRLVLENTVEVSGVHADSHQLPSSERALTKAASNGDLEIVRLLLEYGADAKNERALFAAAGAGSEEVIRLLLKNGADPTNESALMRAVSLDNADVVRTLIDYNKRKHNDALLNAAYQKSEKVVRFLLDYGTSVQNRRVLRAAVEKRVVGAVQTLLENGANPQNAGALEYAAENGYNSIVKLFLKHGAEVKSTEATEIADKELRRIVEEIQRTY